jgi:hypothetical protein
LCFKFWLRMNTALTFGVAGVCPCPQKQPKSIYDLLTKIQDWGHMR